MSKTTLRLSSAVALGALMLSGCASLGTDTMTTASIPEPPKVDPACVTLTSQIDTLRREGIADKVANAAVKKYKMTPADLAKAAELNKANADFQAKCGTVPQRSAPAQTAAAGSAPAVTTVTGGSPDAVRYAPQAAAQAAAAAPKTQ